MKTPSALKTACSFFSGFNEPWFVAGGWAIDLALDRVTRTHDDVDFCIFREALPELFTHFANWKIEVCLFDSPRMNVCQKVEDVIIPQHELHLKHENYEIEILINETNGKNVLFRRDNSITLPIEVFSCWTKDKIPFVHPAWQLLFKSKYTKEKDQKDFEAAIRILSMNERKWLYNALKKHQPDSKWLKELIYL